MKKVFVTGARGFVGDNLIKRLKLMGIPYVRYDAQDGHKLENESFLSGMMDGCDFVFHLAANADVRRGWEYPTRDLTVNTVGTSQVLEAMRANGIKRIGFASSSAVYGDAPNPKEDCPWPTQTSLYGASKVAGEALCQAYAAGQGFEAYIFRFVPLLGEGYKHGHVFDFVNQLREHPDHLTILGDGTQRKNYLYVQDCLDAMLHLIERRKTGIYNLCSRDTLSVSESAQIICEVMGLKPKITYSGGGRGWVGDAPNLNPNPGKLYATEWRPKVDVQEALKRTVAWMLLPTEIFK
jgi:UDP-glucose 4-epimerase